MKKLFAIAMLVGIAGLAGCPKKDKEATKTESKTEQTAKVVEDNKTKPEVKPDSAAVPQECTDYKAAVAKAAACEKLGAQRDELQKQLDEAAAGWAKLDDAGRAGLKDGCKASTETVTKALTAACP